jgi:DNA mismatch repair protein MutS
LLKELISDLEEQPGLVDVIKRAIVDDPPATVKEGGIIKDGFDPQLDELRAAMRNHREWIAQLQQREIQRTGIQSLKVRYNAVFGYYIEVTKANLDKVPPDYIRKQTLVGAERFITPELKEIESKILGAEERSVKLEYELFQQVREQVLSRVASMQRTANALATLDVLASFAEIARLYDYCKPEIGDEGFIIIRDGRHPVLEQCMVGERFVPNDTELAASTSPPLRVKPSSEEGGGELRRLPQIALITGPNMAGKSTYIRQVALITLMAHIGCFVPAKEARIDLVDRIFTRIGAGDDLARGQSTFMVEMTETANILNNATPRSLIVLDEVGRGTSTFDGIALAWSIVEYLHNRVGAKTLFATHYHELTELAGQLPRMRNYNVAVREWQDRIIFLHKIIEGATDRSYGLHVARLAGVPQDVIARARVILANLEETELTPQGTRRSLRRERDRERLRQIQPTTQLDLFA